MHIGTHGLICEIVTYTAQLQILKCMVNGMCYRVIAWALKFMITKKT